jgi:hypothetical protein
MPLPAAIALEMAAPLEPVTDEPPRGIDEEYVDELLELFRTASLDLVYKACFAMREGRAFVEIGDVVNDAILAVELAAGHLS